MLGGKTGVFFLQAAVARVANTVPRNPCVCRRGNKPLWSR